MVPASWAYIKKMSGDKIGQYASQLRYIEIGSAYMLPENKYHLMNLLPNTRICMHYGLTEASRSCFISFHDDERHLDSVGKPSPNTDIKVFDVHGNEVSDGENGEICIKGKHVCSDYWGMAQEEFHKDFFGDYFRTGDWGHKSSEGYIYLISRLKEIINVGGKKVSPVELEEALNEFPGVKESACVGVHDDVLGEVVKAYYVGNKDIHDAEARKFLFNRLEAYKIPVFYEHIDEIPKTQNGKIQRLKLK
jgi:long-chain acyl-CoA synthetase